VARYASPAPPLAGLLEKAARDNRLDVPESQDRPEVPHGKKYVERTTVIRLRKTSMLQLAKMLEQIEQQRLSLAISRLDVRRRGGERDSYDVELGVSAFDRAVGNKEPTPAGAPTGGTK
jgi:general secretion pathway protein M